MEGAAKLCGPSSSIYRSSSHVHSHAVGSNYFAIHLPCRILEATDIFALLGHRHPILILLLPWRRKFQHRKTTCNVLG